MALGCRQKEEKRTERQKFRREGDRRKRRKGKNGMGNERVREG